VEQRHLIDLQIIFPTHLHCSMKKFVMKAESIKPARSYWVEGIAIVSGILGLALILAPDRLHDLLLSWAGGIKLMLAHAWRAINLFLDHLTVTQLAGFVLLLAFLAILAWRVWWRLANSARLSAGACPVCGGSLYRVHRSSLDRLLGSLSGVPLRRYRCSDEDCGWEGLLRRRRHHQQPINE
jgi:predicted RNA-binding Zn-ribbon protein involved in translation (DUF1610 family)